MICLLRSSHLGPQHPESSPSTPSLQIIMCGDTSATMETPRATMEPVRRCGKPCQQRFIHQPRCPDMCQLALGHRDHCDCRADHQPIRRLDTYTWLCGDKCYHMRSWRQGKVVELPEGDKMRIVFDEQQKQGCWCGWSGGYDSAVEFRYKHCFRPGENPLPNVYWSNILEKWHNVIDDRVKTDQMVARTRNQSSWAGFVKMMLARPNCNEMLWARFVIGLSRARASML
jgi:hypothetical protein